MEKIVEARTLETVTAEILTIKGQTERLVLENSIAIGQRLCEAKELVGHGNWGSYLENRVEFSQSTAINLMRLYREYGEVPLLGGGAKSQPFANLTYSQALALLAAPPEVREELAAEAVENNDTVKELRQRIAEKEAELADALKTVHMNHSSIADAAKEREKLNKALEKAQRELKTAQSKADAAGKRVKEAEARAEELQGLLEEKTNTAGEEMDELIAQKDARIMQLEKQLSMQGDPHALEVKRLFAEMQRQLEGIEEELEQMPKGSAGEDLRRAICNGLRMMAERME